MRLIIIILLLGFLYILYPIANSLIEVGVDVYGIFELTIVVLLVFLTLDIIHYLKKIKKSW